MWLYRKYEALLHEEGQMESKEWFKFVDEKIFTFKRKINLWLNDRNKDEISCATSERSHSNK